MPAPALCEQRAPQLAVPTACWIGHRQSRPPSNPSGDCDGCGADLHAGRSATTPVASKLFFCSVWISDAIASAGCNTRWSYRQFSFWNGRGLAQPPANVNAPLVAISLVHSSPSMHSRPPQLRCIFIKERESNECGIRFQLQY